MRITHMFAVLLAILGFAAVTPATATTNTARLAVAAPVTGRTADQYRSRYGYRLGRGYRYGYRSNWRRYNYRPRYYQPRYYSYRPRYYRSRLVCRTSWRWGRPHRVCFRR